MVLIFYMPSEIKKEINASRLVCSEMIHFVYQLQYYILFEVIYEFNMYY
jgi:hypothetical protein